METVQGQSMHTNKRAVHPTKEQLTDFIDRLSLVVDKPLSYQGAVGDRRNDDRIETHITLSPLPKYDAGIAKVIDDLNNNLTKRGTEPFPRSASHIERGLFEKGPFDYTKTGAIIMDAGSLSEATEILKTMPSQPGVDVKSAAGERQSPVQETKRT